MRALAGEIRGFTGLDDPYEEPLHPEVVVDTEEEGVDVCVEKILRAMDGAAGLPAGGADEVIVEGGRCR